MALPEGPQSRVEQYLSKIAGQDTTLPEGPHSRVEQYLEYIAANGTVSEEEIAEQVSTWLEENIHEDPTVVIDSSLSVSGAAADAKAAGDEVSALKADLNQIFSNRMKQTLLDCFSHVAWADGSGQHYYDALYNALYSDIDESLPDGYTRYDYIVPTSVPVVGDNGVMLDTELDGTYCSVDYEHDIMFKPVSRFYNQSSAIYGQRGSTGSAGASNGRALWINSGDNNLAANYAGVDTGFVMPLTVGEIYRSVTKDRSWIVNDTTVQDNMSGTWSAYNNNIHLFGILTGASNKVATKSKVGIYYFKVKDLNTGKYIAYMLPCTDPDETPGFYDVIRKKFYSSINITAANDN